MISAYLDRFEGDLAVLLLGDSMVKVFRVRSCRMMRQRATI